MKPILIALISLKIILTSPSKALRMISFISNLCPISIYVGFIAHQNVLNCTKSVNYKSNHHTN
jgi:hypothetical protein